MLHTNALRLPSLVQLYVAITERIPCLACGFLVCFFPCLACVLDLVLFHCFCDCLLPAQTIACFLDFWLILDNVFCW